MDDLNKVVIVGGGITGLAAAYYMQEAIKQNGLPHRVKLLEASDRLGGKIQTIKRDGFLIERGADSFLGRKKHGVQLIEQLGICDQLVRNETGQAFILLKDQLHPIPQGSFMGIPTQIKPFLASGLFSTAGKLRTCLDLLLPKGDKKVDQSLGHFLRRRLGNECVEHIIEPLLSGVYSSDIDEMSLMATFPNFYELEQAHGSLIRGLRMSLSKHRRGTGKRPGQFFALKEGFSSLISELENQLDEGTIERKTQVEHIERDGTGFIIYAKSGQIYRTQALLMATPHQTLPTIFKGYDIFQKIKDIPVSSVANVALAFDEKDLQKNVQGTGFVVSRKSNYRITACTWTNEKWPHTTPDRKVLLRAYVGKPTDQDVVSLSDEDIMTIVLNDLQRMMPIYAEPKFSIVTRYKHVMPQYTVGHQEKIRDVKRRINNHLPGLFLAGSSYEGVGVPDCIKQAKDTATDILQFLKGHNI